MTNYYNSTQYADTAVEIAHAFYLADDTGLTFDIDEYDNAILTKSDGSRLVVGTEYTDGQPDGYTYTLYSDGEIIAEDGDSTLTTLPRVIADWAAR